MASRQYLSRENAIQVETGQRNEWLTFFTFLLSARNGLEGGINPDSENGTEHRV